MRDSLPTLLLQGVVIAADRHGSRMQLASASPGETGLVDGIGTFEQGMRAYVYPFMRMTMDHDRNFGGGALERIR